MNVPTVRRESQHAPTRMRPISLDHSDRIRWLKRSNQDRGIPQVEINFGENEFAQGDIFAPGEFLNESLRPGMMGRVFAVAEEKQVGID